MQALYSLSYAHSSPAGVRVGPPLLNASPLSQRTSQRTLCAAFSSSSCLFRLTSLSIKFSEHLHTAPSCSVTQAASSWLGVVSGLKPLAWARRWFWRLVKRFGIPSTFAGYGGSRLVAQLCPTLVTPCTDCSPPSPSVHGISGL